MTLGNGSISKERFKTKRRFLVSDQKNLFALWVQERIRSTSAFSKSLKENARFAEPIKESIWIGKALKMDRLVFEAPNAKRKTERPSDRLS